MSGKPPKGQPPGDPLAELRAEREKTRAMLRAEREETRAVTRELHEALQAAKAATRELEQAIRDAESWASALRDEVCGAITERMENAVNTRVRELNAHFEEANAQLYAEVAAARAHVLGLQDANAVTGAILTGLIEWMDKVDFTEAVAEYVIEQLEHQSGGRASAKRALATARGMRRAVDGMTTAPDITIRVARPGEQTGFYIEQEEPR